jgi:hypothetical protein
MKNIKIALPILIFILILSCSDLIVQSQDSNNNLEDFETTWNAVNSVYPLLEYKKIDWDSLYTVYRPRAEQARGDEIQNLIIELLTELKDGHVLIITNGGGGITPYIPPRVLKDKDAYHPLIVRNYFNKELKLACLNAVEYEILENDIGYIGLAHFNGESWLDDFHVVMNYLRDTNGLIIDVRGNTGGYSSNYDAVVSRFINTQLEYLKTFTKGEVPWGGEPIKPDTKYFTYTNPVVVLINGASFSGGDVFPELMKKLPNVTLVGDTTAGAAVSDYGDDNIHGEFKLDCGITISISTVYVTRNDGLPIEWNGVLPDIRVVQTEDDIKQGIDKQLEYAIQLLD